MNLDKTEAGGILLVEDNEDDVILTRMALAEAGIHAPAQVVRTAEEAMAFLSGEGGHSAEQGRFSVPRVVFVDLVLPGRSGHEVLGWMLEREELRSIVRVVLTGSDDPADLRRAYELGANCYLRKPLTPDQLTQPGRNLRMLFTEPHGLSVR